MRYKLKYVLDDQILKTRKFAKENQDFFLSISCQLPALLWPGYMTLLTQSTQISEEVSVSLFCACSNSQSSHLSPKCFPILLIRTKGVLPTLFRMLGRIFRGSGLEQTQRKSVYSQEGHTTTTQHFLFQPAFSFTKLAISAILVQRNIQWIQTHNTKSLIQKRGLIRPGFVLKISK